MLEIGASACCVSSSPQRGCWEIARKAREIGFKRQKSNCIRPRQDRASASERSRRIRRRRAVRRERRRPRAPRWRPNPVLRGLGFAIDQSSTTSSTRRGPPAARDPRNSDKRYELFSLLYFASRELGGGGCAPLAFMASSVISGQWSYSARLRRVGLWETETLSGAGKPISIATVPKNARRRLEAAATSH